MSVSYWLSIGAYSDAVRDFTTYFLKNKDNAKAWHERAMCYHELRDYPQAIADDTRAIAIEPMNVDHYYNRAIAHAFMNEWTKCIDDNTTVVELDSKHIDGWMNRGVAWSNLGNVLSPYCTLHGCTWTMMHDGWW